MRRNGGTEKARRESKMTIGAWGHGASRKFGDVDFGSSANRDLFDRELRWYNHYLKGEDNGVDREPPIELFYMGINKWCYADDWPLPETKFTPYYLAGAKALRAGKPSDAAVDRYIYD